jgi:hypothetical protein
MDRENEGNAGGDGSSRNATCWLDRMWFHEAHQALLADFDVEPEQKKQFVEFLFDAGFYDRGSLTQAGGLQRFYDCLHPRRAAKFRLTEVIALARQFDRRALLSFALGQVGGPQVSEHAEIQRLTDQVAALAAEVAALRESRLHRDIDRRMHPAVHAAPEQRPNFSLPDPPPIPDLPEVTFPWSPAPLNAADLAV